MESALYEGQRSAVFDDAGGDPEDQPTGDGGLGVFDAVELEPWSAGMATTDVAAAFDLHCDAAVRASRIEAPERRRREPELRRDGRKT